jgi:hypothetical protein
MTAAHDGPKHSPILAGKDFAAPSVFEPENLSREARQEKNLPNVAIAEICILDPIWKQHPSTHCTTVPQAGAVLRPRHHRMAMIEGDFEKGEVDGSAASLAVIATAASAWRGLAARHTGSA